MPPAGPEHYLDTGVMDIPLSNDGTSGWIAEESRASSAARPSRTTVLLVVRILCPAGPMDPNHTQHVCARDPLPLGGWLSFWREKWSEPLMRKAIAYYYGMVTCIDDHVGQLVGTLGARYLPGYPHTFRQRLGEMLGDRSRRRRRILRQCYAGADADQAAARIGIYRTYWRNLMSVAPTCPRSARHRSAGECPALRCCRNYRRKLGQRRDGLLGIVSNDKSEVSKCVRTDDYKYLFFNDGFRILYLR